MWLKIYIFVILLIVVLTLFWYWRELQREKNTIKKNDGFKRREPMVEVVELEKKPVDDLRKERVVAVASNEPVLAQETIKLEIRAYPDQPYMGYELLQSLLAAGFRYGEMNVFNRYDEENKRILFSLGVSSPTHSFELSTMGGFSCSGLIVSMPLEGGNLLRVFNLMLDTATQLIEDLGGELLDEKQYPVNDEVVTQWQERIKIFEGKQNFA